MSLHRLHATSLPIQFRGYWWCINPWTGNLVRFEDNPKTNGKTQREIQVLDALTRCDDPFLCGWESTCSEVCLNASELKQLESMHRRLLRIGNRRFLLSLVYASFLNPLFDTTRDAISSISYLPAQRKNRTKLCLQRTLLAAKTSRSFAKQGVLFIGAHLETYEMHAWIIEDGMQPDYEDREWINYQPLLALTGS